MKLTMTLALVLALASQSSQSTFVVPNFRDTTLRTRVTQGLQPSRVEILRLKGPRERFDSGSELSNGDERLTSTHIWQCDQKAWISFFSFKKTFLVSAMRDFDRDEVRKAIRERSDAARKPEGPIVTITTDSEDTGERRQMAGYEQRRIKTTMTVKPSPGASTPPSKTEIDGWYVEVPGLGCREEDQHFPNPRWHFPIKAGSHDRFEYVNKGVASLGRAVEETETIRSEGNLQINKVELLEFSNDALDESLFEVPPGYTEESHQLIHKIYPQNNGSAAPNE